MRLNLETLQKMELKIGHGKKYSYAATGENSSIVSHMIFDL